MRSAFQVLLASCLAAILVQVVFGATCQLPSDGIKDEVMPDIFALSKTSYSFVVEANYNHLRKTHYITEYYDRVNMCGKLEIEKEGQKTTIVYFNKTNEYFETDPYKTAPTSCSSQILSELSEKEFEKKYTSYDWINLDPQETIVGPSNIFRKALLRVQKNRAEMVKEKEGKVVRGMKVNVWTWCKGDIKVQFSFTDPNQEQPAGFGKIPVPVQITVEGKWEGQNINENFQFVGMRVDIPQRELDLTISIPVTVGCKRLAENLKKIPTGSANGMDVNLEIVYTPFLNNAPSFSYTNNFKLSLDFKKEMTYVEFAPWRQHKENEIAKPGHDTARVIDIGNLFVFDMDKSEGTCQVHGIDLNFDKFDLPDGFVITLEDDDLFILSSNPNDYHYLGETIERGIPASVFEKVIEGNGTDSLDRTIVTKYYTSDSIQVDNNFQEKNVPLKTVLWKIAFEDNQFMGKMEMNIYDYKDNIPKPHQKFDVTSCFTGKDQSKWFQIVCPLDDNQMKDILPHVPVLANDYTTVLDKMGEDIPPYRIPKLMVDLDKDNLYLTGLILERPDFIMDFSSTNKTGFKNLKPMGITTLRGCAKNCLENLSCTSFSYCGALCTISEDDKDLDDVTINNDCTLYTSMMVEGGSAPTMNEITKAISRIVEEGKFVLMLNIPGQEVKVIDLQATLFRDNIAYGLNGLEEQPEGTAEERFSVYKYGFKMDVSVADEGRSVKRMSFGSCQQACTNKDSCQSFSFCEATLECLLSTKHGEEIPDNKLIPSTQCITLSRNYRDYFTLFSGLSLNHEAEKMVDVRSPESCAKACFQLKDFNCKSFDYCSGVKGDGIKEACWLHKEHFSEMNEAHHVKRDELCGHFSRKYIMEFKQAWHKDMSSGEQGAVISNVTAEDCSRYCKENQGFYCQGFDHCFDPFTSSSVCTLRKSIPSSMTDRSICNAYVRQGSQALPKPPVDEGHSKSATGGLGFLMLLIGLAIGIGSIYGYGYWKANRK